MVKLLYCCIVVLKCRFYCKFWPHLQR